MWDFCGAVAVKKHTFSEMKGTYVLRYLFKSCCSDLTMHYVNNFVINHMDMFLPSGYIVG